jgi:hypothetical protein
MLSQIKFKTSNLLKYLLSVVLTCWMLNSTAQTKTILDSKQIGLFCHDYFDLKEHGFILKYNKYQDDNRGTGKGAGIQETFFYYSKDLLKNATFKMSCSGEISILANDNYLLLIDRVEETYHMKLFDYTGKEIKSFIVSIADIGLSQDLINRSSLTPFNRLLLEVYDSREELHLFEYDLFNTEKKNFYEIDHLLPSANPFDKMKTGPWTYLTASKEFHFIYRRGSNAEYEPSSLAYHLLFYNENFLFNKELLIDNILFTGETLFGKEASVVFNPKTQTIVIGANIIKDSKPYVLVCNYGFQNQSNIMTLFWRKLVPVINNNKFKLIDFDGYSSPLPPEVHCQGNRLDISLAKIRTSVNEEGLNQFICLNEQGEILFNQIQMGTYEQLNLDGYCVDNDNLYKRIKGLQMNATLKKYCEQTGAEALDINYTDRGEELLVIKENKIKQVLMYYFRAKE